MTSVMATFYTTIAKVNRIMAAWYVSPAAGKNRVYRSSTYQSQETSVYKKDFRLENTTNTRKSVFERLGPCPDQRSIDNKNDHPVPSGENESKRRTTKRAWNAKCNSVNNKIDHNRSTGQSALKRVIIKRTWDATYADKNQGIPDKKPSKPEVNNRDITVSSADENKVTVKRIAEVTYVPQQNLADLRDRLHRVRKERETTHGISNPSKDSDCSSKGNTTSAERLSCSNQNAGPSTRKGHSRLSENSQVTKSLFDEINKYSNHFQISSDPEESDSLDLVTDTGLYVSEYSYEFSNHPIHKSQWRVEDIEEKTTNTLLGNGNSFRESCQCPAAEKMTMNFTEGSCQQESRKRKAPSTDDWAIHAPPTKRIRLSSDVTDLWSRKGDSPISFDRNVIASQTSDDFTDWKRPSRKRKAPSDENWVTDVSPAKRTRLMYAV